MKSDRRKFIKTGALTLAGTAILGEALYACSARKGIVGIQLYSVREDMARDPAGSLGLIAAMGYKYIEHASYSNRRFYGYSAPEFRKIIDDLGLKMISGHTTMDKSHWDESGQDFSDSWKQTIDDAAFLGQKYVITPGMDATMRQTYDDFRRYMDLFNRCGELCRKQGMKFGYHNHDFEFREKLNNERLFDVMMKSIDPDLVVIQLDIGNLFNGGAVASDVVNQYPGRFENIHVKDTARNEESDLYESTIIGEGVADVRNVLKMARDKGGAEVYIIEQESYRDKTPMDCVKRDLEIMHEWGY